VSQKPLLTYICPSWTALSYGLKYRRTPFTISDMLFGYMNERYMFE
jgi:hypothetical protein